MPLAKPIQRVLAKLPRSRLRRTAVVVVIAVLAMVVLSLPVVPGLFVASPGAAALKVMTAKERLDAQNNVRQSFLQAIAGLVLLAGGVATWENIRIAHARRVIEEQGQVTERFTRAIDQLGNDKTDVQIGGIYALERIAHESPVDRVPIAEVLAAFVRGHARQASAQDATFDLDDEDPQQLLAIRAPSVQAALSAFGRIPKEGRNAERVTRSTDIVDADLRGADFGLSCRSSRSLTCG